MSKKNIPIVFQRIHKMLLKRAGPDGKIDRNKLFEIIAERVGKISEPEKNVLVFELQTYGVIKSGDKFGFVLIQEC